MLDHFVLCIVAQGVQKDIPSVKDADSDSDTFSGNIQGILQNIASFATAEVCRILTDLDSHLKYLIAVSRKQDNSPGHDPTKCTSYVVYSTTPDDPHAQLFILAFNYQTRLF